MKKKIKPVKDLFFKRLDELLELRFSIRDGRIRDLETRVMFLESELYNKKYPQLSIDNQNTGYKIPKKIGKKEIK